MKRLTVADVEAMAHILAKELLNLSEPIPDFSTRYPGRLESCLDTPFNEFLGLNPYPKLEDKAAILFYLIIKNHPFENGNKRLAVTTLLVFLALNEKWINVDPMDLYNIAKSVAESPANIKDSIVSILKDFINNNLVAFPEPITKEE